MSAPGAPNATRPGQPSRRCPVCGQTKPVREFYVVKARHDAGGKRLP